MSAGVLLLVACAPDSATTTADRQQPDSTAAVPLPPARESIVSTGPVIADDTVLPASIRVGGLPLVVDRQELQRHFGPPDSTYVARTVDAESCFEPDDDTTARFEVYQNQVYLCDGEQRTFLQSQRRAPHLLVQLGTRRLTERTTPDDLQIMFPTSYQHSQREADGRQYFYWYPPALLAPDEWYVLIIENGRARQFKHQVNCVYD
ncbi:hypothetical protein Q5H93_06480 [Hymenobacter sp. ASUV-10]|uniref:Lipoprotein n=1 Tax=Hymenobacter aranciens TaxID=3063996 RepID=A0ABT9B7W2_9BACT|nr:hypothetical protein [Hymenobacter sp. ASUV-10]MDO7874372.1 hypothetical protein [Hymenobacter sp. ASUV-10]